MKTIFKTIQQAIKDFLDDECMASGAAIAYYMMFSLPPLLVIVLLVANSFGVSSERMQRMIHDQIGLPLAAVKNDSDAGAQEAQDKQNAESSGLTLDTVTGRKSHIGVGNLGLLSRLAGFALLLFSATGVFGHLQFALNRAWEVEPDPQKGGIKNFIMKRIFSVGLVVVIVFLLLVSLVITAVLDEVSKYVQGTSTNVIWTTLGFLLNNVAAIAVGTLLFASMFKILPDAKMAWRDVWIGAAVTAVLFVAGKSLIGLYLGHSKVGADWGTTAASFVALLVWVYYSALIVLFGAELTQVIVTEYGHGIEPAEGAVRKVEEKHQIREPEKTGMQKAI